MSDNNQGPGLTEENVTAVQENWKVFESEWKILGPSFIMRLFEVYPRIRTFFDKLFEGMTDEEIRDSERLRNHAVKFRNGVGSYIKNLDVNDLSTTVSLIQRTADSHFKRGIRGSEFRMALQGFLDFMKDSGKLENQFTQQSWAKVLNVVGDVIEAHMEKKVLEQTDGQ